MAIVVVIVTARNSLLCSIPLCQQTLIAYLIIEKLSASYVLHITTRVGLRNFLLPGVCQLSLLSPPPLLSP
jgi:hypothetical protein